MVIIEFGTKVSGGVICEFELKNFLKSRLSKKNVKYKKEIKAIREIIVWKSSTMSLINSVKSSLFTGIELVFKSFVVYLKMFPANVLAIF